MEEIFCVGPGTRVKLTYTLFDEDGDVIDATEPGEPLEYTHGFGQVIPGLEQGIEGMRAGQKRGFTVPAADAYGDHDPDGLFQVSRGEFPDPKGIRLDDEFVLESPEGDEIPIRVVDLVDDDHVLVDANHPLAGVDLRFEVTVEGVRAATEREIEEAERAMEEHDEGCGCGHDHDEKPATGLVSLGRKPPSGPAA